MGSLLSNELSTRDVTADYDAEIPGLAVGFVAPCDCLCVIQYNTMSNASWQVYARWAVGKDGLTIGLIVHNNWVQYNDAIIPKGARLLEISNINGNTVKLFPLKGAL